MAVQPFIDLMVKVFRNGSDILCVVWAVIDDVTLRYAIFLFVDCCCIRCRCGYCCRRSLPSLHLMVGIVVTAAASNYAPFYHKRIV